MPQTTQIINPHIYFQASASIVRTSCLAFNNVSHDDKRYDVERNNVSHDVERNNITHDDERNDGLSLILGMMEILGTRTFLRFPQKQ